MKGGAAMPLLFAIAMAHQILRLHAYTWSDRNKEAIHEEGKSDSVFSPTHLNCGEDQLWCGRAGHGAAGMVSVHDSSGRRAQMGGRRGSHGAWQEGLCRGADLKRSDGRPISALDL